MVKSEESFKLCAAPWLLTCFSQELWKALPVSTYFAFFTELEK